MTDSNTVVFSNASTMHTTLDVTIGDILVAVNTSDPSTGVTIGNFQVASNVLPTVQYLTGDYTNATTSSSNVFTGITTEANAVYLIEYNLRMSNSAVAASSQLQITAPASSTVVGGHINGSGPAGLVTISGINTLQAVSTATVANNAAAKAWSNSIVVTTSSTTGTLSLGAAAATGTTTVSSGSWIRITKIS